MVDGTVVRATPYRVSTVDRDDHTVGQRRDDAPVDLPQVGTRPAGGLGGDLRHRSGGVLLHGDMDSRRAGQSDLVFPTSSSGLSRWSRVPRPLQLGESRVLTGTLTGPGRWPRRAADGRQSGARGPEPLRPYWYRRSSPTMPSAAEPARGLGGEHLVAAVGTSQRPHDGIRRAVMQVSLQQRDRGARRPGPWSSSGRAHLVLVVDQVPQADGTVDVRLLDASRSVARGRTSPSGPGLVEPSTVRGGLPATTSRCGAARPGGAGRADTRRRTPKRLRARADGSIGALLMGRRCDPGNRRRGRPGHGGGCQRPASLQAATTADPQLEQPAAAHHRRPGRLRPWPSPFWSALGRG